MPSVSVAVPALEDADYGEDPLGKEQLDDDGRYGPPPEPDRSPTLVDCDLLLFAELGSGNVRGWAGTYPPTERSR